MDSDSRSLSSVFSRRFAGTALLVFLLLASLTLTLPCPSRADEQLPYKVGTTAWAGWSFLDVAEALGFWKDEGINVTVVRYPRSGLLIEALRTAKVDFSTGMLGDVIGMHNAGHSLVVLAETNWSHGGDKLIIHKDTDLHNHVGGPIGIHTDSFAGRYFLHLALAETGLSPEKFRLITLPPEDLVKQFNAGRLPAILHYEPFASAAVRQGDGLVLATSADFSGSIPEGIFALRSHTEALPREDIRKLLRGIIRACDWIRNPENWTIYSHILESRTLKGTGRHSPEQLRSYFEGVRIHSAQELARRNAHQGGTEIFLKDLHAYLESLGIIREWKVPEEILDASYLREALETSVPPGAGQ